MIRKTDNTSLLAHSDKGSHKGIRSWLKIQVESEAISRRALAPSCCRSWWG